MVNATISAKGHSSSSLVLCCRNICKLNSRAPNFTRRDIIQGNASLQTFEFVHENLTFVPFNDSKVNHFGLASLFVCASSIRTTSRAVSHSDNIVQDKLSGREVIIALAREELLQKSMPNAAERTEASQQPFPTVTTELVNKLSVALRLPVWSWWCLLPSRILSKC